MTVLRRDPARIAAHTAADLAALKSAAVATINDRCGAERAKYITTSKGQESVYALKKEEARAWLADPAPVLALYPHMQAEVGLTAPTPAELAQIWMNVSAYWAGASARIEGARMRAFAMIAVAGDAAGIDAVVAAFRPE